MSNESLSSERTTHKYNYYRRQDCELMNAGPPLDFSFRNADKVEGMVRSCILLIVKKKTIYKNYCLV